ncbi:hypothetical protein [Sphingobium sp. DC-2]|uniref:hypothetical protein n=1 Tax=Sphingobium sp. DC-2 TaxID=1303256 RepID=UPI0004C468C3|nr:hypothetical protein [Sphingobium sp. DC-2]
MQNARNRLPQKDGASQPTGPRQGCLTEAGSHVSPGQVSAKIRALFDVIGEGAFPFPDGRILQLKPERVKIFRIHREVQ